MNATKIYYTFTFVFGKLLVKGVIPYMAFESVLNLDVSGLIQWAILEYFTSFLLYVTIRGKRTQLLLFRKQYDAYYKHYNKR